MQVGIQRELRSLDQTQERGISGVSLPSRNVYPETDTKTVDFMSPNLN